MAIKPTYRHAEEVIIDLDHPPTGHRLAELVRALTGCSVERAELAVGDPVPMAPASPEEALDTVATALVRLRSSQRRASAAKAQ